MGGTLWCSRCFLFSGRVWWHSCASWQLVDNLMFNVSRKQLISFAISKVRAGHSKSVRKLWIVFVAGCRKPKNCPSLEMPQAWEVRPGDDILTWKLPWEKSNQRTNIFTSLKVTKPQNAQLLNHLENRLRDSNCPGSSGKVTLRELLGIFFQGSALQKFP